MLQFNAEVLCNFIASFAYLVNTILCFIQGSRRKNRPLQIMGLFSAAYALTYAYYALSYMLIFDNSSLAYDLNVAGSILIMIPHIIWFVWMDYVQYERVRALTIAPILMIAASQTTTVLNSGSIMLQGVVEGSTLIGYTFTKVGLATIWDGIAIVIVYCAMTWYFFMQLRHAPPKLKPVTKFLSLFTLLNLIGGTSLNLIQRLLPPGGLSMILGSVMMLQFALVVSVFTIIVIRVPQLFYILGFKVSRLMIIDGGSGVALFDYKFTEHKVDQDLFSGLMQGLQQASAEVFQQGFLTEIRLETGILILQKYPLFTLGLLSGRSSRFLAECLDRFAEAFDTQFHNTLVKFNGDVTEFGAATALVDKFFQYIPRYADQRK